MIASLPSTVIATPLPAGVDAGRLGKEAAPAVALPELRPVSPEKITATSPKFSPETANVRFVLKKLLIAGNTAFDDSELAPFYMDKIGHELTVAELFDIMAAIQQKYLDAGYTLTKVSMSPQDIKEGVVRFDIVEGYVAEVTIEPSVKRTTLVEATRNDILAMRPLNTIRLERLMLLLNDRPGIHVVSVISSLDHAEPGSVRLTFKQVVPDQQITGSFGIDNAGSKFVGPYSGSMNVRLSGEYLPNNSDLTLYGLGASSIREMQQGGMRYTLPVFGASGTTVSISGSTVHSQPGDSLKLLEVESRSSNLGLAIAYPIIRQRSEYLQLTGSFNYQNATTDLSHVLLYEDQIRSVSINANYSFSDTWNGSNSLGVELGQGLDILGARKTGSSDLSRAKGHSDFTKLEAHFTRQQMLNPYWSAKAGISAQYAFQPLLSSEEFGFGGELGRGYDPSEITGDHGLASSIEIIRNNLLPEMLPGTEGFVFYEAGKIWNIDPGSENHATATSAGLGVRFTPLPNLEAAATIAFPFNKPLNYTHSDNPRWLMSMQWQF